MADEEPAKIIAKSWGPCIQEIVEDSEKTGKELATAICETDEAVGLFGDRVIGDSTTVPRTSRCAEGKRIGEVHTHPLGKFEPLGKAGLSELDVESLMNSQDVITCSLTPQPDGEIAVVCAEKDGSKVKISKGVVEEGEK